MNKKTSFIQTGLSQTIASIDQRKSRNGPPGRRMNKFGLNCRPPEETVSQIQARHAAELDARFDTAVGVGHHRHSDLPFRPQPNSVILSSVLAALLFAASSAGQAATINAASPSLADVTAAIVIAADGDTVIIPAGTASWSSGITLTKGITIQGQTTTDSDSGTANDQTVLVDNLLQVPGGQSFFHCTTNTGQSLRITGITFSGVGGRSSMMYNGAIRFFGTSDQVRIDHCHFSALYHSPSVQANQTIYGVSDHNIFDNLVAGCWSHVFRNGTGNGDLEFSQGAGYGGSNFFFVEDCYINNTVGNHTPDGGMDASYGAKFVVRHCHLFNVEILCHGTELNRSRGGRAQEIYDNDYHWSYDTTMDGIRSGSLIAHDNTFSGNLPTAYGFQTYRLFTLYPGTPWLAASGDNPWDVNVTEPDGTHVDGHPPYLFESGTATSGSENCAAGLQYLTDTSKNWTTNQWGGYTARRLSDNWIGQIISNTNNTLTMYFYYSGGGCISTWRAGNQYQIHNVLVALDQPGRGRGDLITGDPPINSTTGTATWPHQELEPCYSWNNIHSPGGEHINFTPTSTSAATLLQDRDYFNDTTMPGYTPYVYPHPLVSGSPTPTPTPNPTGTPSPTPTSSPTPTVTATPTPCVAIVPNLLGIRLNQAQAVWQAAEFRTTAVMDGPPGQHAAWQSIPAGAAADCNSTVITVSNRWQ